MYSITLKALSKLLGNTIEKSEVSSFKWPVILIQNLPLCRSGTKKMDKKLYKKPYQSKKFDLQELIKIWLLKF